jgi:hypothetical protein
MHGAGAGEGLFWAAASNCNRDAVVDKRIRGTCTWCGDGTAPTPRATGGRDKRARQRAAAAAGLLGWVEGEVAVRLVEAGAGGWRLATWALQSPAHGCHPAQRCGCVGVGVGVGEEQAANAHVDIRCCESPARPHVMAHCPGAGERGDLGGFLEGVSASVQPMGVVSWRWGLR